VTALSQVEKHRADLDRYVKAMHALRDPWGISLFQARANCMGVPDHLRTAFRLRGEQLAQIDGGVYRQLAQTLDEFVVKRGPELLTRDGSSAWAQAARQQTVLTAELAEEAFDCAQHVGEASLPGTLRLLNAGAEATGLQPGGSLAAWQECVRCWEQISVVLPKMDPGVFRLDLDAVVDGMRPAGRGFIRRAVALGFSGGYRRARTSLRQAARSKLTSAALLNEAIAARDAAAAWAMRAPIGAPPAVPMDLSATATSLHQTVQAAERLSVLGAFDAVSMATPDLLDLCMDLVADRETLNALPTLARMQSELDRSHVMPLVSEVGLRSLSADEAGISLSYAWWSSIHEHVSSSDSTISGFRRQAHDREAAQYFVGDEDHIMNTSARVLRAVAERSVQVRNEYPAESDLVQKQARLRRGHLPIRDLFQAARHVLTAIKPCWAMSPLVVSQLLPNEGAVFNVVIFDEASQITPADAVGPLLRATHAVVAGDRRQLPPTSFFIADTPDTDDEQDEQGALTKNLESILDVMAALLPAPNGTRTLEWHYRSRDERLIAFSNAQPMLYDWSLTTFPGVTEGGCLEHVLVEWEGATGQEGSSSLEVEQVVQLVLRHAAERPEESLGVIAMGIKHADRISESLRRALSETVELDEFFAEDRDEPFFVKNLERVQGDERDAIILSVGYGKGADGRMFYRFGPLNTVGGERRLNVAITRAKRRLTLVSSFSVSDLDPARLRSEGAQMLHRYLAYAESGGQDLGRLKRHKPELNPFERDVLHHLMAAGMPLIPQYGVSGYWIDFAAQHPTQPGRMVLAIEADGAMYHSARTVRDRDRLRQQHLERLGWRFHRIWSTEWFLHREQEIERAMDAYHYASTADGMAPRRELNQLDRVPTPARGPRPPVPRGLGINDYSDRQLDAMVGWISSDTLVRTHADLLQAAMQELGFERRGERIVERLTAAIKRALPAGG
jgi:very-short-patch-repair endonuclease